MLKTRLSGKIREDHIVSVRYTKKLFKYNDHHTHPCLQLDMHLNISGMIIITYSDHLRVTKIATNQKSREKCRTNDTYFHKNTARVRWCMIQTANTKSALTILLFKSQFLHDTWKLKWNLKKKAGQIFLAFVTQDSTTSICGPRSVFFFFFLAKDQCTTNSSDNFKNLVKHCAIKKSLFKRSSF